MRCLRVAVALGLTLGGAAPAAAQNVGELLEPRPGDEISRVGTRGANFLEIGVGARAMGLAGTGAALGNGLDALYWNTAAIVGIAGAAAGLSTAELYGNSGIRHTFAGVVLPVGVGAIAASFSYFTSGDIERTTEFYPAGGDPTAGEVVEWSGTAIALHYSRRITDRLSVGAAAKYVEEGVDFATAKYLGFDLGTLFDVGIYGLTLGASVTNIGTEGRFEGAAIKSFIAEEVEAFPAAGDRNVRFDTKQMQLPTALRFAFRTSLLGPPEAVIAPDPRHELQLFAQVLDGIDTRIQTSVGLEYGFRGRLYLRGGKRFFNESQGPWDFSDGLTGGVGVRWPVFGREIALDYAYVSMGVLRETQLFSIEYGF